MVRAASRLLSAGLLIVLLFVPAVAAQEGSDVTVVGQHAITVVKNRADEVATVREAVYYRNDGDAAYTGDVVVDLDPQATIRQVWFVNAQGAPIDAPDAGPFPTETAGAHTRHRIPLADRNVSFEPGATYGLQLVYTLPGDDRDFTRGFVLGHPSLQVTVGQATGLVPRSDDGSFQAQGPSWAFVLDGASQGQAFAAGSAFNFTWVESQVPMTPLVASVQVVEASPLTLRASASGGIPPYAFSWDLDADGACDDGENETIEVPEGGAAREVAVCVTDGAAPQGSVRQEFVAQTIETGVAPGSWLFAIVGLLVGALLVFGLVQGGILASRGGGSARPTSIERSSLAAEPKDMLEVRQRVMIAALKELEIAKKKGEVSEGLYTPLKAELKQDTVRVMREIEKRKGETV